MAVDYFLKIEGIEGESEDDKHKSEIELSAFNWEEIKSGTFAQGGGGGAGKVQMKNLEFTSPVEQGLAQADAGLCHRTAHPRRHA